jgi:hypothetical protein
MRKFAGYILLWMAYLLLGCSARTQHSHWKNVGDPGIPSDAACGQRITFEFADKRKETWIYPCWPQKNVPKCVEGCEPRPKVVWISPSSFEISCPAGWHIVLNGSSASGGYSKCERDVRPVEKGSE